MIVSVTWCKSCIPVAQGLPWTRHLLQAEAREDKAGRNEVLGKRAAIPNFQTNSAPAQCTTIHDSFQQKHKGHGWYYGRNHQSIHSMWPIAPEWKQAEKVIPS